MDFVIYKPEMEGIQIMTKGKIGERSTFLQAQNIMRIGEETVIGEADRTVCLTFLNMSDRLMRNLEPKHGLLSFLLKALPGRLAQAKPIG